MSDITKFVPILIVLTLFCDLIASFPHPQTRDGSYEEQMNLTLVYKSREWQNGSTELRTESPNQPIIRSRSSSLLVSNDSQADNKGNLKILNHPNIKKSSTTSSSSSFIFPNHDLVKNRNQFTHKNSFEDESLYSGIGFVFPKDDKKNFVPTIGSTLPNCAQGSSYCTKAPDYPLGHIKQLLAKNVIKDTSLFGVDIIEQNVTQRFDSTDELPQCASAVEVIYPQMAENKEGKWLFLINHDKYEQGVLVEKCLTNSSCILGNFPGFKTMCQQKYIYRKLMALNGEGEPIDDAFRVPSCCSCVLIADAGHVLGRRQTWPMTSIELRSAKAKRQSQVQNQRRQISDLSDSVIFPDDLPKYKNRFLPKIDSKFGPRCANGTTFCENVAEYPIDYIRSLTENDIIQDRLLFGTDDEPVIDLANRFDDVGMQFCESMTTVVFPQMAENKDKQWMFVVNDGKLRQGVRVEVCANAGASCHMSDKFPHGYVTTCKQKFINRKMVALKADGSTVVDLFPLPSCCECFINSTNV